MYEFQRTLMRAIARNNFCHYMVGQSTRADPRGRNGTRTVKAHVLIGSHLNVTVASLLYDYLVTTMDRIMPYQGMEKRGRDALLWLAGCTDHLRDRLDEQRRAQVARDEQRRREAPTGGRALVTLADLHGSETDLNMDHLFGFEPGTTARNRRLRDAEMEGRRHQWDREVAAFTPPERKETPAQAKARKEREKRDYERAREKSQRYWDKIKAKRSSTAYLNGSRAAQDIGLDPQVARTTAPKEIK